MSGVAWSLEVEVQFYLLIPPLCRVFDIRPTLLRRSVLVAAMGVLTVVQALLIDGGRPSLSLLNFLQFFLAGLLLADIYLVDWRERPSTDRRWDMIALFGWPCLLLAWHSLWSSRLLFIPLAVLLFCAAFRGSVTQRFFRQRWIVTVGGMCYSLYLLDHQVILVVGRVARHVAVTSSYAINLVIQSVLILPLVLAVSIVFVERPCMDRDWWLKTKHHIFRRRDVQPSRSADALSTTDQAAP